MDSASHTPGGILLFVQRSQQPLRFSRGKAETRSPCPILQGSGELAVGLVAVLAGQCVTDLVAGMLRSDPGPEVMAKTEPSGSGVYLGNCIMIAHQRRHSLSLPETAVGRGLAMIDTGDGFRTAGESAPTASILTRFQPFFTLGMSTLEIWTSSPLQAHNFHLASFPFLEGI